MKHYACIAFAKFFAKEAEIKYCGAKYSTLAFLSLFNTNIYGKNDFKLEKAIKSINYFPRIQQCKVIPVKQLLIIEDQYYIELDQIGKLISLNDINKIITCIKELNFRYKSSMSLKEQEIRNKINMDNEIEPYC